MQVWQLASILGYVYGAIEMDDNVKDVVCLQLIEKYDVQIQIVQV